MAQIARYADGVDARRGDVLVDNVTGALVDFLYVSRVLRRGGQSSAFVVVRGMEREEIPASRVGLVVVDA